MLEDAAARGPDALCLLIGLCLAYARRAESALADLVTPPRTVTLSPEPRPSDGPDSALTAAQAARETGWTPQRDRRDGQPGAGWSARWFYEHADELPFTIRRPGDRAVRFSRAGLRAWIAAGGRVRAR